MKRIEILSLNNILNPLSIQQLSDSTALKVLKIKSAITEYVRKIEEDKKLFTEETKPETFKEGVELTDALKAEWENKFQPIYGSYLWEDSDINFDKLTDQEFVELTKGSNLTIESFEIAYNLLTK